MQIYLLLSLLLRTTEFRFLGTLIYLTIIYFFAHTYFLSSPDECVLASLYFVICSIFKLQLQFNKTIHNNWI